MIVLQPMRFVVGLILLSAGVSAGCASNRQPTTRPANVAERQDAALRDPFDYKPDMGETDITGGDLGHLDGPGMRRDVDHVLNP